MKKQNLIEGNKQHIKVLLVSGVVIFILFSINTYLNSVSYICFKNPDKCVCASDFFEASWDFQGKRFHGKLASWSLEDNIKNRKYQNFKFSCSNWKMKTQAEKDIDDCNRNPREDDKCKCEKNTKIYDINCQDKYNKKWIRQETDTPFIDTNDRIKLSYFFPYCFEGVTNKCLKSRPKTECEKGNPDWVKETECKEFG